MITEVLELIRKTISAHPKGKPLTPDGDEMLDPTPMAPPIGYKRQIPLHEQIRAMVRSEKLAMEAEAAGAETFDEADDFDIDDEMDPSSPYEANFDPMTPTEKAALRSQGKDVDNVLTAEDRNHIDKQFEEQTPVDPPSSSKAKKKQNEDAD